MKTKTLFSALVITLSVGLIACKSTKQAGASGQNAFFFDREAYLLGENWVLEWMDSVTVDTINFAAGIPHLVLSAQDSSAEGTTGCNNLHTRLLIDKENSIKFEWLATTKMYCLNSAEPSYLDYLTRITNYKREGEKLTLLEGEKPLLRYMIAD